ncbi:unnamed protein product, partial [Cochlearia groenlandica]
MRTEDIAYPRPVTICFNGCQELVADMAAALASASIVFKYDVSHSLKLSSGAKAFYAYAESMKDSSKGLYSVDLLIWGGAWLYYATGDLDLLNRVTSHDLTNHDVVSFNTKTVGAQLLLTRLRIFLDPGYPYEENLHVFHDNIANPSVDLPPPQHFGPHMQRILDFIRTGQQGHLVRGPPISTVALFGLANRDIWSVADSMKTYFVEPHVNWSQTPPYIRDIWFESFAV